MKKATALQKRLLNLKLDLNRKIDFNNRPETFYFKATIETLKELKSLKISKRIKNIFFDKYDKIEKEFNENEHYNQDVEDFKIK